MGTYTFKLPDVGEGIAEAEIAEWHVKVGDVVDEDQTVCDMLTEKASVEIPSPVAGKIISLGGAAGEMVAVGGPLLVLDVEGEGNASKADSSAQAARAAQGAAAVETPAPSVSLSETDAESLPESEPEPAPAARERTSRQLPRRKDGEKPLASPAVRRRARELGIELAYVAGTGPAGRISHDDLDTFRSSGPTASGGAGSSRMPRMGTHEIKVIGLRRKIAEAMQRSKQRIPHFAYVEEIDVTELEALRTHLNGNRRPEQSKLTVLPFLVQAIARAIPEFPMVNAIFDDEQGVVTRYEALHVGIATQTPNGLVVPVIRHAEALDVWAAAAEIKRLADAARAGKATVKELGGSTITITSLGPMGGIASTPVINAPEVGIVGVNKIVERPMVVGGQIAVRKMMNLSSSFDHRIVDGWDAAAFIQRLKSLLEFPATLFID